MPGARHNDTDQTSSLGKSVLGDEETAINPQYVVIFVIGAVLLLGSMVLLHMRKSTSYSDMDDEQDLYRITREMDRRDLDLQKKINVSSMYYYTDNIILDKVPVQEV